MSMQNQCLDFYGQKLKVGDEVIPMLSEALVIGISGVISKIEYNEEYKNHYITITDKEGNILLPGVDAKCYTTQERFDERENQEYVYSLNLYNSRFGLITTIPLTNRTNSNLEISEYTCFITLSAIHLQEKGKQLTEKSWSCPAYSISNIYYLIVDNKTKVCYKKQNDLYYLLNPETHYTFLISKNHRIFKNNEEMKKYVKGVIEYFNSADLTYVNNNEEFDKNEKGKHFERKLIQQLKH